MAWLAARYRAGPCRSRAVAVALVWAVASMAPFGRLARAAVNVPSLPTLIALRQWAGNDFLAILAGPLEYLSPARRTRCTRQCLSLVPMEQARTLTAGLSALRYRLGLPPYWSAPDHAMSSSVINSSSRSMSSNSSSGLYCPLAFLTLARSLSSTVGYLDPRLICSKSAMVSIRN